MITVYYNSSSYFELTQAEFNNMKKLHDEGFVHVKIDRLGAYLSPHYLWAGEKPKSMSRNEVMFLPDGLRVRFNNFGQLVGSDDNIKVDEGYYRSRYGKEIEELLIPFDEYKNGKRIPQIETKKIKQLSTRERKALQAGEIISNQYDTSKFKKTN